MKNSNLGRQIIHKKCVFTFLVGYFQVSLAQNISMMTIQGSRLKESCFKTLDLTGEKMCVRQCSYHSDCTAVNFNRRQLSCELLTHSGNDYPGNLQNDADFIHIHNITNNQFSDFCSKNPCPAHHRCVKGHHGALCVISECSTQEITLINGNITNDAIPVGEPLKFTCFQGYSKRVINATCLSDGQIQNADKLACYKMEDSWTIVYKIQSNSGAHPVEMFNSNGTQQERNASFPSECMTMAKVTGCSTPYRTGLIDVWEDLGVQEVRFTIVVNATWTQEIVFNGLTSNKMSWYSGNRVVSSSWTDVTAAQSYQYFSVNGYSSTNVNRLWTITYSHGGCSGDVGWFLASYNPPDGCSYDISATSSPYPVLRVCPKSTKCMMQSETVEADAFAVAIKADNLN